MGGEEEIVTNCKCKAFRNIRDTVGSVKNMMCIDSRESRSFGYGYGMNTIWFQYLLCKDMSFACYFFTQGWNQGDFGQYYLYDNLLDSSSGLTDDALLTLAVVGGGLGGAGYRPRYAPAHGHYYPTTPEPEPETEPLNRRRRSGILSTPNTDGPSTASASRRRRQATSTFESSTGSASRRRRATPTNEPSASRRRRATPTDESSTSSASRRRRATPEPSTASAFRRRRATPATPTTEPSSSRRRRSTPTTEAPTTNSRRRRATPACCDLEGDEVCESDQDLC